MRFPNIMAHPLWAVGGGLLLAVIIVAAYFGFALAYGLPPFPPEQNSASNIQIVLDRSFAMAEPFGDGTKLEAATRSIDKELLTKKLASSANLAFRQYGGSCGGDNTRLSVEFDRGNQENVRRALRNVTVEGQITLVDGIIQAIRDFAHTSQRENPHNEILIFAGGYETCQIEEPGELIRQEMERLDVQVNIRFMGLGVPFGQRAKFDETAMAISGELPFYANSPIELEERLTKIIEAIELAAVGLSESRVVAPTPTISNDAGGGGGRNSSSGDDAPKSSAITPPPTATPIPTSTPAPTPTSVPPTPPPPTSPPPTVSITSPTEVDTITQGSTIAVSAEASDDREVTSVEFTINGIAQAPHSRPPYSVEFTVPARVYLTSSLPHLFIGTVTINGSPAPEGTVVVATVEGDPSSILRVEVRATDNNGNTAIETGTFNVSTERSSPWESVVEGGKYLMDVDDLRTWALSGKTVGFMINGLQANETVKWERGGATELNLTVTQ